MRRALALAAAVAMIVGAIVLRSHLAKDHGAEENTAPTRSTLVCSTEVAAVCEALRAKAADVEIRIEEAARTEATLVGAATPAELGFDAWLVPQPFPAMVAEQRGRATSVPVLDEPTGTLARSPLVAAVWKDRLRVLEATCGAGGVTWKCIGELAGTPWAGHAGDPLWGPVKPGHPVPDSTATGLLVLAQATGSWFGASTYASNDFGDPAFATWFERLERGVPYWPVPPRTPLDEMLSKGSATFDIAGATEAETVKRVTESRDKDLLEVLYPSPAATADIVLVRVTGSSAGGRLTKLLESDDAAAAFTEAHWRVGDTTLAPDDGLPRPGVLQALRSRWIEVVR